MDTGSSNREIAHRLVECFPSRFSDLDAAQSYIGDLAVQFSLPDGMSSTLPHNTPEDVNNADPAAAAIPLLKQGNR